MQVLIPLLISTIAGLSTCLGALIIFFKIDSAKINRFITFCLAFSASVMIGISIFDLIPESFFAYFGVYGLSKSILLLVIAFIISYIVITFMSTLINKQEQKQDLYKLGILNMIVLILHNLPEGIATFLSSYQSIDLGIKLSVAIMLHNIPEGIEGISIAVPIYYATGSKMEAFKKAFLSGIAEPIGAILAFIFLKNYITDMMISIILVIVNKIGNKELSTEEPEEDPINVIKAEEIYNEKYWVVCSLDDVPSVKNFFSRITNIIITAIAIITAITFFMFNFGSCVYLLPLLLFRFPI